LPGPLVDVVDHRRHARADLDPHLALGVAEVDALEHALLLSAEVGEDRVAADDDDGDLYGLARVVPTLSGSRPGRLLEERGERFVGSTRGGHARVIARGGRPWKGGGAEWQGSPVTPGEKGASPPR